MGKAENEKAFNGPTWVESRDTSTTAREIEHKHKVWQKRMNKHLWAEVRQLDKRTDMPLSVCELLF